MLRKSLLITATLLIVSACAPAQPRVIQASAANTEIRLKAGIVTQIEMPDAGNVQSITVGNPALVSAEQSADVVNLMAKEGAGETNLIIRSRDTGGRSNVYQYRIIVQTN